MHSDSVPGIIRQALDDNMFTGAALILVRKGHTVLEEYFGRIGISDEKRVDSHTLFDLASLTKVLATTPCWMKLLESHPEALDSPISRWFERIPHDKTSITPRLLLAHSSGLPAWRPYYLFNRGLGHRDFVTARILNENLAYPTGGASVYSDLGFILLAHILEKQTSKSLDEVCKQLVYGYLDLCDELLFNPSDSFRDTAQTRSGDKPGTVNDLNARALGGVAGHAGLFGTAKGVARLSWEFVKSLHHENSFFDQDMMKIFVTPCTHVPGSSRALGFDTKSAVGSSCGSLFGASSFGHTGFTGTSVWTDPERELVAVFLTNRVAMGESDLRIKIMRPTLHDKIIKMFQRE